MDARLIDEVQMRLLDFGITNEVEQVLREWGWTIADESPELGAYRIEVVLEIGMLPVQRLAGQATWDPRPAPVDFDMLRDEALMDAALRVLEYGEHLTRNA
jgi:hypothetical protein